MICKNCTKKQAGIGSVSCTKSSFLSNSLDKRIDLQYHIIGNLVYKLAKI